MRLRAATTTLNPQGLLLMNEVRREEDSDEGILIGDHDIHLILNETDQTFAC